MPRQPSIQHPLRTARNTLGLSQPEFGARVGVAGGTIQQIENGNLKISPGLAQKISDVYGLDPDQLVSGDDPLRPRFVQELRLLGQRSIPFTREGYEKYAKAKEPVERKEVDPVITLLGFAMELMVDAAVVIHRGPSFVHALRKRLQALSFEFGLEDATAQILKDYGLSPENGFSSLEQLFDVNATELAALLKNRDHARPWRYGELGNKKPILIEVKPGKSAKKRERHLPPPDRDNAAEKPSSSRHGPAAG